MQVLEAGAVGVGCVVEFASMILDEDASVVIYSSRAAAVAAQVRAATTVGQLHGYQELAPRDWLADWLAG